MNNTEKQILAEFDQMKGQLVITESWKIERLIAISEDDMDYYYVTYDGRKLTFNTCVGAVYPLKGKLEPKHYNRFVRGALLNHQDKLVENAMFSYNKPSAEKIEELKQIVSQLREDLIAHATSHGERFLTEICWDLEEDK